MDDTIVTMDAAGRVVLPKPVRDKLRLQAQAKLRLSLYCGSIELAPIDSEEVALEEEDGILVVPPEGKQIDAAAELDELRNERR